jgi:hypothetical protein
VVTDSIAVTKALGYNYLWIDKYCINQGDKAIKHMQIRHMDSVYEAAEITIVAAAGEDEDFGLPGLTVRPRTQQPVANVGDLSIICTMRDPHESIHRSRWSTRGWTYQEALLSRRRLVFTAEQIYFECNAMNCCESFGNPLDRIHVASRAKMRDCMRPGILGINDRHIPIFDRQDAAKLTGHLHYLRYLGCIEKYSSRNLTFESDSLNAFRGIARCFSKIPMHLDQIWGIPYITTTTSPRPDIEMYFFHSLAWHHPNSCWDLPNPPKRRCDFPSWSWAGWEGQVVYPARNDIKFIRAMDAYYPLNLVDLTTADTGIRRSFEEDLPRTLVLSAWALHPDRIHHLLNKRYMVKIQGLGTHLRPGIFFSEGAGTEAETLRALNAGQIFRFIFVGSIVNCLFMFLILKHWRDGESYSRVGLFLCSSTDDDGCSFLDTSYFLETRRSVFRIV